jgi:nucleoside-diphosphate-sugar epimerase
VSRRVQVCDPIRFVTADAVRPDGEPVHNGDAHQEQLTVFGEQFWRPYVHVRDAAQAIVDGLQAPAESIYREVFNIGNTAENYRKIDIIAMIQERLRSKAEIDIVTKAEDPRDYRVSFEKARRVLGFEPLYRVQDGIDELIVALENGIIDPTAETYHSVGGMTPHNPIQKTDCVAA